MPIEVFGANYQFLPREEILRFGEIEKVARSFVALGVTKLRITGGEPLMRRGISELISKLSRIEGVEDIAMTSNGALLEKNAAELKESGLHRVTVSLDSLDAEIFSNMNGVGAKPDKVIAGIDAALSVGLGVKLNTVIKKGVNEAGALDLVKFARERQIPIRFIEFMDTGNVNGWKLDDVVPSSELLENLQQVIPLVAKSGKLGETSKNFVIDAESGGFEVGFISSVTKPFCNECNRARLSADGHIFTCLFAHQGMDIKTPLRDGLDEQALAEKIGNLWGKRSDRYSELRSELTEGLPKAEMSYLGG